jgi:hypothetical protein
VTVLAGDIRLWQIFVLALLFGTFSAADNPARLVFVPEVVGHGLTRPGCTRPRQYTGIAASSAPDFGTRRECRPSPGHC